MKTFIAITVLATTLLITQIAQAKEDFKYYLTAKAGFSLMEFDDPSYYSTIGGDTTWRYDSSGKDNVFGGGLGLGYCFSNNLRAEIEYFYRTRFDYSQRTNDNLFDASQELKTQTLMAQIFYDFKNNTSLTPYVFAGVGVAYHKAEASAQQILGPFRYKGSNDSTEFAWNIGVGTSYEVNDRIAIDFMYRYLSLGEVEWENNRTDGGDPAGGTGEMIANEFLFAVRYSF